MRNRGQSMVELLIAIGLSSLLLPSLFTSMLSTREGRAQKDQRFEAISLLKEASEALRVVREKDWSFVSVNGEYHPEISGTSWVLLPNQETSINGFTRKITISDVQRDNFGTGKIVESGGTIDPSTKKAVIRVSWSIPSSSFVESTIYLTRFKNQAYKETTVGDFDGGTKTGTVVTNTEGGEVILTAGGRGEWCEPSLTIATVDLPKQGVANALTAIATSNGGQAFAGTGENASGVSFANVEISNPPYPTPPAGNVVGTFDGYKTNDVFGEENYAYIATDNNSKEVVIIDLIQKDANNKYQEVGNFNAPGNVSAESVFVLGSTGYATAENKLYTFDLSSKSGSRPKIGEVPLAGTGEKVYIVGSYAYVAVDSELTQMQIIDVSNPGSPSIVGQARLNASSGKSIFINSTGTRAYLATESSYSQNEFFIIDVSAKTGDRSVIASYDTNGMDPKGITAATNNKAIVVGHGGQEYQVFDLSGGKCGGLNIDTGVNGVSTVIESDGDIYAYIITGDANAELKIIEGGPGGAYSSTGVFESKTFDAGKEVSFNSFSAVASKLPQTDLKYQIGVVKSSDCSTAAFTFVGSDGTPGTYFATSSAIPTSLGPGYENPGRCLRYKAFLSTQDLTQTPVFHEIIFNYSL